MYISSCYLRFYSIIILTIIVLAYVIILFYRRYGQRSYINFFVFFFLAVGILGLGYYKYGFIGLNYSFWLVLLIGLPVEIYLRVKRSKQLVAILHDGDPETFLAMIEKDMNKSLKNSLWRRGLDINKAAGLYYLGRWQEALEILEQVPQNRLPLLFKFSHLNNKLANHIGLGDVAGAQKILDNNTDVLNHKRMTLPLFYALKRNQSILEFLKGNLIKSRVWINECLESDSPKISKGVLYYYLGLIDQKEGKGKQAQEHFKLSFETAPKTYFGQKARELLEK